MFSVKYIWLMDSVTLWRLVMRKNHPSSFRKTFSVVDLEMVTDPKQIHFRSFPCSPSSVSFSVPNPFVSLYTIYLYLTHFLLTFESSLSHSFVERSLVKYFKIFPWRLSRLLIKFTPIFNNTLPPTTLQTFHLPQRFLSLWCDFVNLKWTSRYPSTIVSDYCLYCTYLYCQLSPGDWWRSLSCVDSYLFWPSLLWTDVIRSDFLYVSSSFSSPQP